MFSPDLPIVLQAFVRMAENSLTTGLTGVQKAAIVLLTLGPKVSAEVFKKLNEDEITAISAAIARLEPVTPNRTIAVLEEFQKVIVDSGMDVRGSLDRVRALLCEAFGSDYGTRLVDRVAKALDGDAVDFSNLRKVDPQQLGKLIQDEHPQTIALVLSHLDPSQAAMLIGALPKEIRADVAMRMAGLEQISPESVRIIASVISQKLRNLGELSREACGGARAVADMCNRMDPNSCTALLDSVEKEDPALFESVRRFMFVFEDLKNLDAEGIKELLNAIDRKVLVVALKGTSEKLQQHFMASLSKRATELLKEELQDLGPVRLKDVDAAQQSIITLARQLEKQGVISLSGSPTEVYVT